MTRILLILKSTWKIVWRLGLFFIGWGLLLAAFFLPYGPKLATLVKTYPIEAQLYTNIASAMTILIITWLATRFIDHRSFKTIGFTFDHIFRDLQAGFVLGVAWLSVSVGTALILGWAFLKLPIGFAWPVLIGAAIAMLFNVLTQELLLCGFIFQTIRDKSNVIIAIIVSSILFSGYHAGAFKGEWLLVVNVFGAGLLFCLAYVTTKNLWLPISLHFTWNVLLGPVLGLTESGKNNLGGNWKMVVVKGPQLITGGEFGLEGGLIVTITVFLMIFFIYHFLARRRSKIKLFAT